MQPQKDDNTVNIPIPFDYSGGKRSLSKGNIVISVILLIITIVLTIMILFNKGDTSFIMRLVLVAGIWVVIQWFIRFPLLGELRYSDAYETLKAVNGTPPDSTYWKIYDVERSYPHICHFKNGQIGIFVRFEKNVTVGKGDDVVFNHYEAIGNAYNLVGNSTVNMVSIDYMDNVGNDVRMSVLADNIGEITNPDMKDGMQEIYANLQEEGANTYSSFDVYLFTSKRTPEQLWNSVYMIIQSFMRANFITYKVLNASDLRLTCIAVNNLYDFSVSKACQSLYSGGKNEGIVPIVVHHADGTETKINQTTAEKEEEYQRQVALQLEERKNKKKRGKNKSPSVSLEKVGTDTKSAEKIENEIQDKIKLKKESISNTEGSTDTIIDELDLLGDDEDILSESEVDNNESVDDKIGLEKADDLVESTIESDELDLLDDFDVLGDNKISTEVDESPFDMIGDFDDIVSAIENNETETVTK